MIIKHHFAEPSHYPTVLQVHVSKDACPWGLFNIIPKNHGAIRFYGVHTTLRGETITWFWDMTLAFLCFGLFLGFNPPWNKWPGDPVFWSKNGCSRSLVRIRFKVENYHMTYPFKSPVLLNKYHHHHLFAVGSINIFSPLCTWGQGSWLSRRYAGSSWRGAHVCAGADDFPSGNGLRICVCSLEGQRWPRENGSVEEVGVKTTQSHSNCF